MYSFIHAFLEESLSILWKGYVCVCFFLGGWVGGGVGGGGGGKFDKWLRELCGEHIDSLVQDCSNYIDIALELLPSCTKLSIDAQLTSHMIAWRHGNTFRINSPLWGESTSYQ